MLRLFVFKTSCGPLGKFLLQMTSVIGCRRYHLEGLIAPEKKIALAEMISSSQYHFSGVHCAFQHSQAQKLVCSCEVHD